MSTLLKKLNKIRRCALHRLIFPILLIITVACHNQHVDPKPENSFDICSNLDSLNAFLAKDTSNADMFSCRAQLLYEKKDFINALYDISEALHKKGNNVPDLLLLSDVYLGLQNPELARKSLAFAESLDDKDYTIYYAMGKFYYLMQNFELSKGYLSKSIQLEPINPVSFSLLGEILLTEGDTTAAINNYHRAIQVDNNYFPAYMQLATVNLTQNTSLTPQYLKSALTIDSNNVDALYMLGVYYQQNEVFYKAIDYYSEVYKRTPDYVLASYNAGYIYLAELNVFDTAIIWFSRAIDIDSNYYDAIYNRAYSMELLGDKKNADNEYSRLKRMKPDYKIR